MQGNIEHRFQPDKVFRTLSLVILGAIGAFTLLFFIVFLASPEDRSAAGIFILSTVPFLLFGGYFFFRHSGQATLTKDTIIYERFGKIQQLAYQDIIDFKEKDYHLPPNFTLKTKNKQLKIPRRLQNWPHFYHLLRANVNPIRQAEQVIAPWTLSIPTAYFWRNGLIILAFIILVDGLTIWQIFASQATNPLPIIMMIIVGTAIIVIPTIISQLDLKRPNKWVFNNDNMQAHFFSKTSQTWSLSNIQYVQLNQHRKVISQGPYIAYLVSIITIQPQQGEALHIEEDRAWVFGLSPEQLFARLQHLYTPQGVQFKLSR